MLLARAVTSFRPTTEPEGVRITDALGFMFLRWGSMAATVALAVYTDSYWSLIGLGFSAIGLLGERRLIKRTQEHTRLCAVHLSDRIGVEITSHDLGQALATATRRLSEADRDERNPDLGAHLFHRDGHRVTISVRRDTRQRDDAASDAYLYDANAHESAASDEGPIAA